MQQIGNDRRQEIRRLLIVLFVLQPVRLPAYQGKSNEMFHSSYELGLPAQIQLKTAHHSSTFETTGLVDNFLARPDNLKIPANIPNKISCKKNGIPPKRYSFRSKKSI